MSEEEYIQVTNKTALILAGKALDDVMYMVPSWSERLGAIKSEVALLIEDAFAVLPELEE